MCVSYYTNTVHKSVQMHECYLVGTDLFSISDKYSVIIVNYFSNFWELDKLENTNTNCMIVIKKWSATTDLSTRHTTSQTSHAFGTLNTTSSPGRNRTKPIKLHYGIIQIPMHPGNGTRLVVKGPVLNIFGLYKCKKSEITLIGWVQWSTGLSQLLFILIVDALQAYISERSHHG